MAIDDEIKDVPAWQKAQESLKNSESCSTKVEIPVSEEDLLQVARAFLEDDEVKKISRSEKIEYLKAKGLQDSQIEKLLVDDSPEQVELKTIHDTTTSDGTTITPTQTQSSSNTQQIPSPSSLQSSAITQLQPQSQPQSQPRRDIPPIITYPEFLLKPQKPPPLVTIPRLINATYTLASLGTIVYGISKYLIEPALITLTESRHDFAANTIDGLEKLNDKLEGSVSHVPYIPARKDTDTESIDSDPTELFHRDIGVQTSPPASVASTPDSDSLKDATTYQTERLSRLLTSISSLTAVNEHTDRAQKSLQLTLQATQDVLDKVESEARKTDYTGMSGVYKDKEKTEKTSEVLKFKQEVRSLKGTLLGSRNFAAPRTMAR